MKEKADNLRKSLGQDCSRYELLKDYFAISKEEAVKTIDNPVAAGTLLFEKGLDMGYEKYESLRLLNTTNLSALVQEDWNESSGWDFSKKLEKMYGAFKQNGEPYIHHLRSEVFERVTNKEFEANFEKQGFGVDFSDFDLLRGTKIPLVINNLCAFLSGVYSSIGSLNLKTQLFLSTSKTKTDFLEDIVVPSVNNLFNLDFNMNHSKRTQKKASGEVYTYSRTRPSITSLAHTQFLQNYLYNPNGQPVFMDMDEVCESGISERMMSYFCGVINSLANIKIEKSTSFLYLKSKNRNDFLGYVSFIGEELGFDSRLKEQKNAYILAFPKKELKKMLGVNPLLYSQYPDIFENHKGIICNPYQLKKIDKGI